MKCNVCNTELKMFGIVELNSDISDLIVIRWWCKVCFCNCDVIYKPGIQLQNNRRSLIESNPPI